MEIITSPILGISVSPERESVSPKMQRPPSSSGQREQASSVSPAGEGEGEEERTAGSLLDFAVSPAGEGEGEGDSKVATAFSFLERGGFEMGFFRRFQRIGRWIRRGFFPPVSEEREVDSKGVFFAGFRGEGGGFETGILSPEREGELEREGNGVERDTFFGL